MYSTYSSISIGMMHKSEYETITCGYKPKIPNLSSHKYTYARCCLGSPGDTNMGADKHAENEKQ